MTSTQVVPLGPVSAALEADVRESLRRHSLVIWLDADGHYRDVVEQFIQRREAGELKYDVYTFKGSHLELMLELEDVTGGVDKTRAVIHLPGFNEDSVKATPLFELYRAGKRYRKALDTLVKDAAATKVRPEQIEDFLQRDDLSLAAADDWLHSLLTTGSEGIGSQLRAVGLIELVDDLLALRPLGKTLAAVFKSATDEASDQDQRDRVAVRDRITALTGIPETWFDLENPFSMGSQATAETLAYTVTRWAMCVSYVQDLTGKPGTDVLHSVSKLPKQVQEECHDLIVHLQAGDDKSREFYRQTAADTEARLTGDVGEIDARRLGKFDTFQFEEETILRESLDALLSNDWQQALDWSIQRSDPNSFWLQGVPLRGKVWQLVRDAAELGAAIAKAGPKLNADDSLEAATEEYANTGAAVDNAHRRLEQNRAKVLRPQMPHFFKLRECLGHMGSLWRDWANGWARDFNGVCRTHGFLPDLSQQQRTLFDDVVKPLVSEHGATAYFVVDALRYEMGQQLFEALKDTPQSNVRLDWRLTELPSVTEVGMNVLAPVSNNGRLEPVLSNGKISGFSNGEYRVSDPKSRQRAMHGRVGGQTCPLVDLKEVLALDNKRLKQKIARADLVMVHSREIDEAGEEGLGPNVFEDVLHQLRSAWHLLRDAGINHFVFTADHGFLLLNEDKHPTIQHGRKRDTNRRHTITEVAADRPGEVRVPTHELNYDCDEAHVVMPESIAVFDTGTQKKGFTHGGNSLQERVIPVLTVSHRAKVGSNATQYDISAVRNQGLAGMHCLSAKVGVIQKSFNFGANQIDLRLRVPDKPSVRVELRDIRGKASLAGGGIVAEVGEEFEVFFRLHGDTTSRVQVELYHPSGEADVEPCLVRERFDVSFTGEESEPVESPTAEAEGWLAELPDDGIRRVFRHLAEHGLVTEAEAADMLGSPRAQRKFARNFEQHAALAPFSARIDVIAGVKRYIREGTAQ